jgi:hypothetical protein
MTPLSREKVVPQAVNKLENSPTSSDTDNSLAVRAKFKD